MSMPTRPIARRPSLSVSLGDTALFRIGGS
jgi:hypothetical protein